MSTNADTPSTSAHPTKDEPTCPGQDGQEPVQDDNTDVSSNNPPTHRLPTHGIGRFLWETPADTPIGELGERYREWRNRENEGSDGDRDDTENASLEEWV
ncbi:hypothetical protein Htur_5279 (plasmid) [Haloterrigena turkmenica DSM 5511]|uniref:Uncharacterized protein n=1 Tax=Haloterrigena turkmenica (strain ATCC 51198 / DSM 5511 / JCM 9101 / NCIMB 13204 / VKM B-1734 / 4k) TaxID=543526 RepID=D2S3R0_HALTV|nr:hypothetical protein [Haloterrigena turkmenica]ADB64007.1 hypothetical protein Htur_5279 [Haloterrigena turkmenica DSM 5511]